MAKTDPIEPQRKRRILPRDDILNYEEPTKSIQLPSGTLIRVDSLAYLLILDIKAKIESDSNEQKERLFSEQVIKWLLRSNNEKDMSTFSPEDQRRLIEVAADEMGCRKEYEELSNVETPEVRFFQAVTVQQQVFNRQLSETINQIIPTGFNTQIATINWLGTYTKSLQGLVEQLNSVAASHVIEIFKGFNFGDLYKFNDIYELTAPTTKLITNMDIIRTSISSTYENIILTGINKSLNSYQNLMTEIVRLDRFSSLPDVVRYYPIIEMRNTSVVAENLIISGDKEVWDEEVITPEIESLELWLSSLDESFPIMLKGARQSIFSNNPDRCRHFASSHRELCTHLLHFFAPDNEVKGWTNDPNHFHQGKPTRKTRLIYIARGYQNETFVDFFTQDFLSQMGLLNADEHRRSQNYKEKELSLLHARFLSTLGFLKEIVENSKRVG